MVLTNKTCFGACDFFNIDSVSLKTIRVIQLHVEFILFRSNIAKCITMTFKSRKEKFYILTAPHPRGHVVYMYVKCEQPLDEPMVQHWLLYPTVPHRRRHKRLYKVIILCLRHHQYLIFLCDSDLKRHCQMLIFFIFHYVSYGLKSWW